MAEAPTTTDLIVRVPPEFGETSVADSMARSPFAADLKSILRTRERLASFTRRLDRYLTGMLIAPGGGSLLRETLESAIRVYLVSGQSDRKVEDARFMGAALAIASAGLMGYRVVGLRGAKQDVWRPLEDGPIRTFIRQHNVDSLRFDLRHPPELAEQRAMRWVVAQNVCGFSDVVAMEHGGVDYRTFAV